MAEPLKMKHLAERTGVTKATIHHYVKEGLLPPPRKTSRNMALYQPDSVERVLLIKALQKQQRRSLAEVKELLAGASDSESLARLRRLLEVESSRTEGSPLEVGTRTSLTRKQLIERTGFTETIIKRLEAHGVLTSSRGPRNAKVYDPVNVDVADALGRLHSAGFDAAAGFKPRDVAMYVETLRELIREELALFVRRVVEAGGDPDSLLHRAEQGLELITPFLLALRRKLLHEMLDAALDQELR